jgi:hypothetical protein
MKAPAARRPTAAGVNGSKKSTGSGDPDDPIPF